ncbi:MAG: redoxin domain-containing protein [Pirellulales bacterium]|nr:redoxin domain-containing protein [Pirellulales bacterium]
MRPLLHLKIYCLVVALPACWPAVIAAADTLPTNAPATNAPTAETATPDTAASLGRQVADFTLRDPRGVEHALSELRDSQLVVVAFLGTECPLANLYVPRLLDLASRYQPRGVGFLAINSNSQDSNSEVAQHARNHQISFPMLKDPTHAVADQFAAVRTPEVFVLDRERRIRYRGRIDDQYGIGFQRPAPTRHDLAAALDELLAGREVSQPVTAAPGCFIGRARTAAGEAAANSPTWAGDIASIFAHRCQICHQPGQLAPFALLEYAEVAGWADTIGEVVGEGRMPPWHASPEYGRFSNDPTLTADERAKILAWVDASAPQGDLATLPPQRLATSGWRIGTPDQIVHMSQQPVDVPAEGTVEYQWFHVDPGFKEDKWIRATEGRPGNYAVVHHVTVYFHPPGDLTKLRLNGGIDLLGGYNPGGDPWIMPPGCALRVPAGSHISFEMHYTPNGVAQSDRSSIGLVFADPQQVSGRVLSVMPAAIDMEIPPGAANHEVAVDYRVPTDVDLLLFRPHMHLRGKSFRYEALWPDGRREILLDVPKYDFNWQHSYLLAEPRRLPQGTVIHCVAHFDNSAGNPSNPDPTATVHWGDQSWEEMLIGIFTVVRADRDLAQGLPDTQRRPLVRWVILGAMALVAIAVTWRYVATLAAVGRRRMLEGR